MKQTNEKNLADRLGFKENKVFLDGKVLVEVPQGNCDAEVSRLGVLGGKRGTVYTATGRCCYSYLLETMLLGEDDKVNPVTSIFTVGLVINDMIPVYIDSDKVKYTDGGTGVLGGQVMMVSGAGCAGSGVRLMSTYHPIIRKVMSGDEYDKYTSTESSSKRSALYARDNKIEIEFWKFGYGSRTVDITERLVEMGLDIKKTMELNDKYVKIRDEMK